MLAEALPPSPPTHTAPAADPAGATSIECTAAAHGSRGRGPATAMLACALASAASPNLSAIDS